MHEPILIGAFAWLVVLLLASVALVVRRQPEASRVLSLEVLVFVLVGVLVVVGDVEAVTYYQDAALVLALLSFVGTLAALRFLSRGFRR